MMGLNVSNVGKAYRSYASSMHRLRYWFKLTRTPPTLNWVLKGMNFQLSPGEAIGVIGHNGAGKSTFLKLLAGVIQPSEGHIGFTGSKVSLLELGTGLNLDLPGIQNVEHILALHGVSAADTKAAMDEIQSFTDIGDYFYAPVRQYSSGMRMRLLFAALTHSRPDLLIIDEVLSVGDIQFQQKCFQRIRSYVEQGSMLVFVTHDLGSLTSVCENTICLDHGAVAAHGSTKEVVEHYFALSGEGKKVAVVPAPQADEGETLTTDEPIQAESAPLGGDHDHYIKELGFVNEQGQFKDAIVQGETVKFLMRCANLSSFKDPHVGFRIQDRRGTIIYETNTYCLDNRFALNKQQGNDEKGTVDITFEICANLVWGEYTLAIGIEDGAQIGGVFERVVLDTKILLNFAVIRDGDANRWAGMTDLNASIVQG